MIETVKIQTSSDGTRKYLFRLEDGSLIETVLMKHPYGNSVCVTSQAGCNMGCAFCASGLLKKVRDLTSDELFSQVLMVHKDPEAAVEVTHIVVMGTGEPFDNYENVLDFCDKISDRRITEPFLLPAVAPRHITVSTCGIIPRIRDFAETKKRYNLAVSLHAASNELRDRLMPVNRKYPLEKLIPAAAEYCALTKRRVTFEYLLLDGINDSPGDAKLLSKLLLDHSDSFYVNLIPYNHVDEFTFQGSAKAKALEFYDILMKQGLKATLRKEHGADITAACGQLRLSRSAETSN